MTDGMVDSDTTDPNYLGMGVWSDGDRVENDLYVVPGALIVVPEQRASTILRRFSPLLIFPMIGGSVLLRSLGARWVTSQSLIYIAAGTVAVEVLAILSLRRQRREAWRFVTFSDLDRACASTGAQRIPLADMTGFVDMNRKWGVVLEQARIQFKDRRDLHLLSSRKADVARIRVTVDEARDGIPRPIK